MSGHQCHPRLTVLVKKTDMTLELPLRSNPIDASNVGVVQIAESWATRLNVLQTQTPSSLTSAISELVVTQVAPWWSDHLALTWDIRTFNSSDAICDLLQYALLEGRLAPFTLQSADLIHTASDNLVYVQAVYSFGTEQAFCTAIVKLVPDEQAVWKAWTVATKLEDLKACREDRSRLLVPDIEPPQELEVLVLGAGQSGREWSSVDWNVPELTAIPSSGSSSHTNAGSVMPCGRTASPHRRSMAPAL